MEEDKEKLRQRALKALESSDLSDDVKESLREHWKLIGVENTLNLLLREKKRRGLR